MKPFDETELRGLLMYYDVGSPSPELVENSKLLMREKILQLAVEPAKQEKWVFTVVGLAVVMSLCLFYMFTVGTILGFILPPSLLDIVHHTLYALTAAGGSVLACALMVLYFKQFFAHHAEGVMSNL